MQSLEVLNVKNVSMFKKEQCFVAVNLKMCLA